MLIVHLAIKNEVMVSKSVKCCPCDPYSFFVATTKIGMDRNRFCYGSMLGVVEIVLLSNLQIY